MSTEESAAASAAIADRVAEAVMAAGLGPLPALTSARFGEYFELLTLWNAKLNLTAIRTSEEIIQRHFVECIFCAQLIPPGVESLLDYGSGAGFPGIPIALCRPEIRVTLAESQGKKASFLREAARTLDISAPVYAGRVEEMDGAMVFDAVTLRAVDGMQGAIRNAEARVNGGGSMVLLVGEEKFELPEGFSWVRLQIPESTRRFVVLGRRGSVPRGTPGDVPNHL